MSEFDDYLAELSEYISELEKKFIDVFLPADPSVSSVVYELDVRAYCILSHAALEQFFEHTVIAVMKKSIDDWIQPTPRINDALLTLAAYSEQRLKYKEGDFDTPSAIMRTIFSDVKETFSREVVVENHGISTTHLRKIMLPVSLQITDDTNLLNSLSQLVKQRGEYAHKGRIKNILSPEDAKKYVGDCLVLCTDICSKAKAKFDV